MPMQVPTICRPDADDLVLVDLYVPTVIAKEGASRHDFQKSTAYLSYLVWKTFDNDDDRVLRSSQLHPAA